MKPFLVISLALILGFAVAAFYFNHPAPPPPVLPLQNVTVVSPLPAPAPTPPAPTLTPGAPETLRTEKMAPLVESPAPPVSTPPNISAAPAPEATAPVVSAPASKKAPILDPDARMALSFVGVDPDAEAYWYDAINDPSLPAEERQDLIEDLNEDGLSNPDNPGPQDLPVIQSRLFILQQLASEPPMDKVNADAIQEAAKDLSKMYADLTQR